MKIQQRNIGLIHAIFGPMFSGKTEKLNHLIKMCVLKHESPILIKHGDDNRYTNNAAFISHSGTQSIDGIPGIKTRKLMDDAIIKQCSKHSVIAIDEGQFYDDLVEFCERMANEMNKIVLVAGLDLNADRKGFNQMPELIALADKKTSLTAVCTYESCCEKAPFTSSRLNSMGSVCVGGEETYFPTCRRHYLMVKNEINVEAIMAVGGDE